MELKPCPFCGGRAELTAIPSVSIHYRCKRCTASGPYHTAHKDHVEQWNTRATDPLLKEMAEALEALDDMFDPSSRVGEIINEPLQKYHEQED